MRRRVLMCLGAVALLLLCATFGPRGVERARPQARCGATALPIVVPAEDSAATLLSPVEEAGGPTTVGGHSAESATEVAGDVPIQPLRSSPRNPVEEEERLRRHAIDPATAERLSKEWRLTPEQSVEVFRILAAHQASLAEIDGLRCASEATSREKDFEAVVQQTEAALGAILTPLQIELVRATPLIAAPPALASQDSRR